MGGYKRVLGRRDLRLLFGGLVVSATGSWAYNVALLAFVFDQTHSLTWVGAAGLGRFIPVVVLGAYAGVIAERVERVRLMLSSDLLCAVFQALLAVVAATGGSVTLAIGLAALTTVANMVYDPAVAAMLPDLAGEDDLVAATALREVINNVVIVAGPGIGAVLVSAGSPALAIGVNAGSFVLSALLVSRLRARSRPSDVTDGGDAGPLAQMLAGLRAIAESSRVALLVGFCALVSFVYGTDTVLFVGASEQNLGTGATGFGYLLAGLGVGGILMGLAMDRIGRAPRLGTIIVAGTAAYCLPTALLAMISSPPLAFVVEVVRGGGTLVVDVLAVTALQRTVAPEMIARVFGVFLSLVVGAIALGTLVAPPVVSLLGLDGALLFFAIAPTALGLLGFPALRAMDRDGAARAAELAPRIAILERVGMFAEASRPILERLAAAATPVTAVAGEAIVREGEAADAIYVLERGSVDVSAVGEHGRDEPLRTMPAGSYFGEVGVLERIPRTATVTAAEDCALLRIGGDEFLDALTTTPPSTTLMENTRTYLARTHPSRRPEYEPASR